MAEFVTGLRAALASGREEENVILVIASDFIALSSDMGTENV
jgi:hypothetical protein